ncbi:MAG: LysM peptidoglycan-binding domain-containing protein [Lachnospiraceae bacterium]|nr:LysM peptidoglycan-binding domain-containing protein [Lachnospiraceae bacterium]
MNRKRALIYALILAAGVLIILFWGKGMAAASAKQEEKEVYYTSVRIEAGDSLWSLAQKYAPAYSDISDYVDTLRQINQICREDRLRPGQILIIPYYQ